MTGEGRREVTEYDLEPILVEMYSAVVYCGSTMAKADIADMSKEKGSRGAVLILWCELDGEVL